MNGLSVTELCCLFCCPPCPGRIAAKLAFLPPEPTYSLVPEPDPGPGGAGAAPSGTLRASAGTAGRWKLHLLERADFQYSQRELDTVEVFLTKSSRGNRISCMYVRCVPGARSESKGQTSTFRLHRAGRGPWCWRKKTLGGHQLGSSLVSCSWHDQLAGLPRDTRQKYTVLFSHGNAVDLGQMSSFYIGLGTRINCNIFSYDYSGYGVSSGKPSEKNLYADIDAAWQALRTRYGISPDSIVLYGQSIGTVPTVDLASRYECAAVVLHSPLTSGMRVAFPDTKKTYCFDAFPNIEKVSKITSPVLIIHGTEDEVIDFSHGLALYERCPKAVEPLWVEGAGHNDIELYSQYLERLRRFISQELPSQRA
ncbi:alpha/beta hydrolase domain-containing protein 17A isoform X1 [Camelus dromedarius]|uniref:palmitoyl-protein hydrolase n=2 Tax=Camelus TaxID=9836 RepID=A0A8B8RX13_CAMFR|nr:LOW QUALITY PROTEIN: alpha/beta hydrolase domain-containing protein 17A [Camelus ferus]